MIRSFSIQILKKICLVLHLFKFKSASLYPFFLQKKFDGITGSNFKNLTIFPSLKIVLILAYGADPDGMPCSEKFQFMVYTFRQRSLRYYFEKTQHVLAEG